MAQYPLLFGSFEHGIVVEERFRSHGRLENLENAIVDYEKAVKYAEPNHGVCRSNYHRRLEDALVAYREKVAELTQDSHPDEAIRHYKLGDASLERFSRHGKLEDLDKAISSLWKAIKLAPDGHLEQANFRNRLGDALLARFERLDSIGDLDGAISSYQKAVDLTPDDVHKPPHLHRLGGGLEARFNRLDDLEALDGAVSTHQQAVELTLDDHPDKPLFLDGLAHAQEVRFKRLHDLKDMENAVSSKRKATNTSKFGPSA
ncbi:hypothetical protein FRB91_004117 [Serendipita sp. 411]|nr:hypothetical protein FRB91_004117 [Serendipita sp. 411]